MRSKKRYYIAYGSNLNVEQMLIRCPKSRAIGTSLIQNYQLLFKGSKSGSYLTIEKKEGASVPVAIWEVTPEDEKSLDRYEGCPTFYYKTEMRLPVQDIRTGKVREKTAFVYIMHEDRQLGIPSWYYVDTCLAGYRTFRFDPEIIHKAIAASREVSA